jgi:hypothetical protein
LRFADGAATDVTFLAPQREGSVAKTGAGEQWLSVPRPEVAETGKRGPPILPDHESVVKTASTRGGLLHSKTPTMSRLGTIDWPSFKDPILVTPVTDLSAVVILSDCPPIYGPANYIRLVRRPGSPRLSNVQTFYGRQTLH